jgi:hypothetical protein
VTFSASAAREPLFTEREAAQMLRISHSYLRLLRAQKRIRYYRFDRYGGDKFGRVLYSERHINEFKRQAEQTPVAA